MSEQRVRVVAPDELSDTVSNSSFDSSSTKSDTSFPWKQLSVLALCRLAEPIAFNSIVAYSFLMVQDIKGVDNASFYAGLLVSAFALAEACTAMFWGQLSDKYGRKPIILIGLAGTALSSLVFGFAKSYWLALLARVLGGALNGNVAVMQTMVAEMVTRPEHEPRAYSMQPFMWSLGSIVGSALGGFAAKPAVSYPGVFSPTGIFGKYPYLLPNLIAVVAILMAMAQGFFFLKETNPLLHRKPQRKRREALSPADETTPLIANIEHIRSPLLTPRRLSESFVAGKMPLAIDPGFDLRRPSTASLITSSLHEQLHKGEAIHFENEEVFLPDDDDVEVSKIKAFNKGVITWTIAAVMMCFHGMAYCTLFPIYLQDSPTQASQRLDLVGGLGRTLPEVGTYLAVNSVVALVVQGFVFPFYVDRFGVWISAVTTTILSPLIYLAIPFVTLLPSPGVGLYIVMVFQTFSTGILYPCLLIMLKNATESPLVLGKVNGVAMSACSASRTIAPPIVGIFYSSLGSAGGWWACGMVALFASFQLFLAPKPQQSEQTILRKASVAVDESYAPDA